jgi:hypothetical protein
MDVGFIKAGEYSTPRELLIKHHKKYKTKHKHKFVKFLKTEIPRQI